jgi:hypothetical protein
VALVENDIEQRIAVMTNAEARETLHLLLNVIYANDPKRLDDMLKTYSLEQFVDDASGAASAPAPRTIRCVVAASDGPDGPVLVAVDVSCTQEQYDDGDHYDAASAWAQEHRYTGRLVVFDENDGPDWLFAGRPTRGVATVTVEEQP